MSLYTILNRASYREPRNYKIKNNHSWNKIYSIVYSEIYYRFVNQYTNVIFTSIITVKIGYEFFLDKMYMILRNFKYV